MVAVGKTGDNFGCVCSAFPCASPLAGSQAISMTTEKPSAGEMKSAMEGDARRANQVRALWNRQQLYIMSQQPLHHPDRGGRGRGVGVEESGGVGGCGGQGRVVLPGSCLICTQRTFLTGI